MSDNTELTYYEYWLTKKVWNGTWAVRLIGDYIKFKRTWEPSDDYYDINTKFHDEIERKMAHEDVMHIFTKVTGKIEGYDENGDWIRGSINLQDSDVRPKEFLEWMHNKGYPMPFEFREFIGIEETEIRINQKDAERIDKAACQAIARTLWDIYPKMTNEEMQYHKAIQSYGGGKGYPADTTLRRWLSDVDPREVKRGRKKKM